MRTLWQSRYIKLLTAGFLFLGSLLLLFRGSGCKNIPADPAPKYNDYYRPDSARLTDGYRWQFGAAAFDVIPISILRDSTARWSGIVTVKPGMAHAVTVYHYLWHKGDTLRIDAYVSSRCNGQQYVFTRARVWFDLVAPRLVGSLAIHTTFDGYDDNVVVSRTTSEMMRDPSSGMLPVYRPFAFSRSFDIPYLFDCLRFRPDTLRVTLRIAPPIIATAYRYPPEVLVLGLALWDRTYEMWHTAPLYVGTLSR